MKGLLSQMDVRRSAAGRMRSVARWIAPVAAVSLWTQAALAAPPTTPTGLNAVTGGDSIVLMWASSTGDTAITQYNVYRDGVHIGTSSAANPGTVYKQGTRFIFTAANEYILKPVVVDIALDDAWSCERKLIHQ